MPGAMRKMGIYLGLVEDDPMDARADDYETYGNTARARSYDSPDERRVDERRADYKRDDYDRETRRSVGRSDWGRADEAEDGADYYEAPASAGPVRRTEEAPGRRALWSESSSSVAVAPKRSSYRITTLHPRTYNEARTIGEHFRDNVPVIMNLSEMDDSDAKRLVDFAAGLSFGLHGSIERVTNKVFLLSPQNVSVTAEDKARIAEGGFFNQS